MNHQLRQNRIVSVFLFTAVLLVASAPAQNTRNSGIGNWVPSPNPQFRIPNSALRWRLVGPFRGGRVESVAGIPGDPLTYYFGAVTGGVWKTTNGGLTWTPITDGAHVFSIGAIAVAPSDSNVIYVGTGEPALRNEISEGDGLYKSADAGKTWTRIGLTDSRHIARIVVDAKDPNLVYVAALGHAFGPNEERGVFRSNDGGKSWKKILYVDDKTGATDLAVDPHDPQTMFAAMYQVRRTAYSMISGGPGSGIYKTTDGGATWKHLQGHGLPDGVLGRIGVAVSGADSKRVYAMIEAKVNALYRSDDGGDNWQMVNDEPIWVRPWYGNVVTADPRNADTVYVQNLNTMRSTDGGRHFLTVPVPHSDDHAFWIDPTDTNRMIEGDDGGASISIDGGKTWTAENNQPTGQFYHVSTDNEFNYDIYGSQQDSSSVEIQSRSDSGAITERDWHPVGGGESGFIWPDPRDPEIVYAGDHNGHFTRYDGHDGQVQNISPWFGARAHAPADLKHRFPWTAPMQLSPHDPNTLYLGGEVVFKTTDGGNSWTIISPDLTRNDKSKQQSSPEPLTPDNSSSEYYDTLSAIAESPAQKGLIWAGSDDGLVHLTRDAGKTWSDTTPRQLPHWARINNIEPSVTQAGTAYLSADAHYDDDSRPMIFKTTDFGASWTELTNGLPANEYVHSVHADPVRKGMLYAGTEGGIFVSFDDGALWQSLQLNLPHVPVYDTTVHGDDLIAATHGRAFWVLDDIGPLRQATVSQQSEPARLFGPAVAYRGPSRGFFGGPRAGGPAGQNPPSGAVIDYYLASAPTSPVALDVVDSHGNVVMHATSESAPSSASAGEQERRGRDRNALPAHAGLNRWVWNLRVAGPESLPGLVIMEAQAGGPPVPPGAYTVKLNADGKEYAAPLQVKPDPRVKATQADYEKQYAFALKARNRVNQLHHTVLAIRSARAQLEKTPGTGNAQADAALTKMSAIEEAITQVRSTSRDAALVFPIMLDAQYAELANVAVSADTAPPAQLYDVFNDYEKRWSDLSSRWNALQPELVKLGVSLGGTAAGK
jgi:photosystem II stability/assembly factor-like uncharacterized protein